MPGLGLNALDVLFERGLDDRCLLVGVESHGIDVDVRPGYGLRLLLNWEAIEGLRLNIETAGTRTLESRLLLNSHVFATSVGHLVIGTTLPLVLHALTSCLGFDAGKGILLVCRFRVGLLRFAAIFLPSHLKLLIVDLARIPLRLDLSVVVLADLSVATAIICCFLTGVICCISC